MASLLDTLKNTLNQQPNQPAPQQGQVKKVLDAKTGKAQATGGPAASSLAEAQTLTQGANALAGVQQQGKNLLAGLQVQSDQQDANVDQANRALDAEQRQTAAQLATTNTTTRDTIASQEALATTALQTDERLKIQAVNNAADQQIKKLASERRVTVADLFASYDQNEKELAYRKDAADLEQLGFLMAMRDRNYLDELNRIGQERNLKDEVAHRDEMSRLVLGNNLSSLMSELGFRGDYNAKQREYTKVLASIDIYAAMSLATAAIKDGNNQAIVSGATEMGKAGADYWARTSTDSSPNTTNTTASSGTTTGSGGNTPV